MSNQIVITTPYQRCLELAVNRPEALNALNPAVIRELSLELSKLQQEFEQSVQSQIFREDFPRVVLLSGTGGKAFVAGADIAVLKSAEGAGFLDEGIALMALLESFPIPTIALVDGFCLGGGLELALSCDLIAASERSQFGLPEINLGLIPGFGGTQRLMKRSGIGTARRLILTGARVSAAEAKALGIIDILFDQDGQGEELEKLLKTLSKTAPLAAQAAKRALFLADTQSKEEGLRGERGLFMSLLRSRDAQEGLSAFLEKRAPQFTGK